MKKLIPPISLYKLETNYHSLYFLIIEQKKKEEGVIRGEKT